MKKICVSLLIFFSLSLFSLVYSKEYSIKLDENGFTQSVSEKLPEKYTKGDILIFQITDSQQKYDFTMNLKVAAIKATSSPISPGPIVEKVDIIQNKFKPVNLKSSGKVYTIIVTRYLKKNYELREKGVKIYEKNFETHLRYHYGLNIGVLFLFTKSSSYEFVYDFPSADHKRILETNAVEPKLILYGTIYPFGFEPSRNLFDQFWRRFQLDIGTELSGSIFKKIYIGLGCNLKLFSANLFACIGDFRRLRKGYEPHESISDKINTIPFEPEFGARLGVSFCIPFDFAAGWIGKVIGVK